ncbi:hypothetical protein ACFXAZ_11550 [Streptomyces sp. NPDC059477]|uniref:hypothetical protein n=1 Tax=Streptomyces sp. NPDC059477 TaxID=3346847 RepID=UPI0036756C06
MPGPPSARDGRPPARYTRALTAALLAAAALVTAANAGPAKATPEATPDGDRVTRSVRPWKPTAITWLVSRHGPLTDVEDTEDTEDIA